MPSRAAPRSCLQGVSPVMPCRPSRARLHKTLLALFGALCLLSPFSFAVQVAGPSGPNPVAGGGEWPQLQAAGGGAGQGQEGGPMGLGMFSRTMEAVARKAAVAPRTGRRKALLGSSVEAGPELRARTRRLYQEKEEDGMEDKDNGEDEEDGMEDKDNGEDEDGMEDIDNGEDDAEKEEQGEDDDEDEDSSHSNYYPDALAGGDDSDDGIQWPTWWTGDDEDGQRGGNGYNWPSRTPSNSLSPSPSVTPPNSPSASNSPSPTPYVTSNFLTSALHGLPRYDYSFQKFDPTPDRVAGNFSTYTQSLGVAGACSMILLLILATLVFVYRQTRMLYDQFEEVGADNKKRLNQRSVLEENSKEKGWVLRYKHGVILMLLAACLLFFSFLCACVIHRVTQRQVGRSVEHLNGYMGNINRLITSADQYAQQSIRVCEEMKHGAGPGSSSGKTLEGLQKDLGQISELLNTFEDKFYSMGNEQYSQMVESVGHGTWFLLLPTFLVMGVLLAGTFALLSKPKPDKQENKNDWQARLATFTPVKRGPWFLPLLGLGVVLLAGVCSFVFAGNLFLADYCTDPDGYTIAMAYENLDELAAETAEFYLICDHTQPGKGDNPLGAYLAAALGLTQNTIQTTEAIINTEYDGQGQGQQGKGQPQGKDLEPMVEWLLYVKENTEQAYDQCGCQEANTYYHQVIRYTCPQVPNMLFWFCVAQMTALVLVLAALIVLPYYYYAYSWFFGTVKECEKQQPLLAHPAFTGFEDLPTTIQQEAESLQYMEGWTTNTNKGRWASDSFGSIDQLSALNNDKSQEQFQIRVPDIRLGAQQHMRQEVVSDDYDVCPERGDVGEPLEDLDDEYYEMSDSESSANL